MNGGRADGSGRIYENPKVEPVKAEPRLSVLSLDIETDAHAAVVYAVGLAFFDPLSGTNERRGAFQRTRARVGAMLPD